MKIKGELKETVEKEIEDGYYQNNGSYFKVCEGHITEITIMESYASIIIDGIFAQDKLLAASQITEPVFAEQLNKFLQKI